MVFWSDFDDHVRRLDEVLHHFRMARLKTKPRTCKDHVVSGRGVSTNSNKGAAVRGMLGPQNLQKGEGFPERCGLLPVGFQELCYVG